MLINYRFRKPTHILAFTVLRGGFFLWSWAQSYMFHINYDGPQKRKTNVCQPWYAACFYFQSLLKLLFGGKEGFLQSNFYQWECSRILRISFVKTKESRFPSLSISFILFRFSLSLQCSSPVSPSSCHWCITWLCSPILCRSLD